MPPILEGRMLQILFASYPEPDVPVGVWIQDLKWYDTKRGGTGIPVENANHGVFGQALNSLIGK